MFLHFNGIVDCLACLFFCGRVHENHVDYSFVHWFVFWCVLVLLLLTRLATECGVMWRGVA